MGVAYGWGKALVIANIRNLTYNCQKPTDTYTHPRTNEVVGQELLEGGYGHSCHGPSGVVRLHYLAEGTDKGGDIQRAETEGVV